MYPMRFICPVILFWFCWIFYSPFSYGVESDREPAANKNRMALVIGNGRYALLPSLPNPSNDATDLCSALRKVGFEVYCRTELRTKREIKNAIFEFTQKLDKESTALFYYAGHALEVDGGNYLLPTEALIRNKFDVSDESVDLNFLMAELAVRKPALSIVMLDACRNNPLPKLYHGLAAVGLNIGTVTDVANSILMFSTSSGSLALDGNGRNGIFTKHLLANIPIPGMSIFDMQKRVIKAVEQDSKVVGMPQTPVVKYSFSGNFCFAGCIDLNEKAREIGQKEAYILDQQKKLEALKIEIDAREKSMSDLYRREQELANKKKELDAIKIELDKKLQGLQSSNGSKNDYAEYLNNIKRLQAEIDQKERVAVDIKLKERDILMRQSKLDQMREELERKEKLIESERRRFNVEGENVQQSEKGVVRPAVIVPTY